MGPAPVNVVLDLDEEDSSGGALGPAKWVGAPRVATPIASVTMPPPAAPTTEAIIRDFPEPAIAFDHRGLCICVNERAAQELKVSGPRAVGLGVAALGLTPAMQAAMRYLLGPASPPGTLDREILCGHGSFIRRVRGTVRPATGDMLVTWTDLYPPALPIDIVEG